MYKKAIRFILHFLIWGGILFIMTLMPLRPEETFSFGRNLPFIITYSYLVCFFYLNADFLTIRLIQNKKYFTYFSGIAVILVIYICFHKYIFSLFVQLAYFPPPRMMANRPMPFPDLERTASVGRIILPFTQFFLFWILSLCYRLSLEWLSTNKRNKEIEAEKSIIELAYLKAQINPHFIFNTLNTIYSLTINKNNKAPDAILLYSDIVRYVFDKIDTNLVPLQEEIDYIANYIDLQKMRFINKLNIEFEIKGNTENQMIAPLILIAFIENAFQYGISNHYESTISFTIEASENSIHFTSKNKKYKKDEFQHIGKNIGIQNTRRKLNLIYPDKHRLSIKDSNDAFDLDLIIYGTSVTKPVVDQNHSLIN